MAEAQIVHWNRPYQCLRTVGLLSKCAEVLKLRLLDNGSDRAKLAELKEQLPQKVEIIELGRNLGWGPAHNIGLRRWLERDSGEFCVVAADDALPQGDCVERMLAAMTNRPDIGVLCPQFPSPEIGVFSPISGPRILKVPPRPDGTLQAVGFAHGTLTVYRRACLRQIGLFDERYFAYGDEIELSLRARSKGWKVAQLWGAVVINPQTAIPGGLVAYLSSRSSLMMAKDYGGMRAAAIRAVLMMANSLRMFLLRKRHRGSVYHPWARMHAVGSFMRREFGPPRLLA
jgi:GT2 family glycosyltransferase